MNKRAETDLSQYRNARILSGLLILLGVFGLAHGFLFGRMVILADTALFTGVFWRFLIQRPCNRVYGETKNNVP